MTFWIQRFRDGHISNLYVPPQNRLYSTHTMLVCNLKNYLVSQHLISPPKRTPSFSDDAMLFIVLPNFILLEEGMKLDLIYCRYNPCCLRKHFNVSRQKIADADMTNQIIIASIYQTLPRFHI